ncbi:hypothetical protein ACQP3L_33435, partial [Escherichia coli]
TREQKLAMDPEQVNKEIHSNLHAFLLQTRIYHFSMVIYSSHSQNTDPEPRWKQKFLDFFFFYTILMIMQENNVPILFFLETFLIC